MQELIENDEIILGVGHGFLNFAESIISGVKQMRSDINSTAMAYSKELRDSIVKRMLPPNNESISKISQEEGLPEATLRKWRDAARAKGNAAPATDAPSDQWSTEDKFLIVQETAGKSEIELAEYCRQKGLYVEQVQAWKDACMQANGGDAKV